MIKYIIPLLIFSIIFFTIIYKVLGTKNMKIENDNMIDLLYFSTLTQTLHGTSDKKYLSKLAKIIIMLQSFSTFLIIYFPIYSYITRRL